MIGRFNTDNNSDVSVQLFGQEIMNLRKKEYSEKNNKFDNNRRLVWNKKLKFYKKIMSNFYHI